MKLNSTNKVQLQMYFEIRESEVQLLVSYFNLKIYEDLPSVVSLSLIRKDPDIVPGARMWPSVSLRDIFPKYHLVIDDTKHTIAEQ